MRRPIVVAALAAALAVSAWAGGALDEAMEAYRQGDYAKALERASSVEAGDPARPKAAYLAGEAALALERWADAEKSFREVLAAKADNVPALVGVGRALTGAGKAGDALPVLEKAAKLDPKDCAARRSMGEAHLAKGEIKEARADLESAVKLDPKDPLSARSLVEACLAADDADAALKAADRLAKALPDHPMGHFLRGLALDKLGKDKDAIEAYELAIAKDDKFLDAHKNLAILCTTKNPLYQDKERTQKAFDHYQRYFDLGGKDEELKRLYETIKSFLESQKR